MSEATLKLGVIGLGRAFSLMLPTFVNDARVQLVAACDPREAARVQFSKDFSHLVFEDVHSLAACSEINAVYIASPHQMHAEHVEIVASHGKHILLEKPMAISMQECEDMIRICDHYKVRMVIGHCHSFDQPYLEARSLIASGKYGDVKMLHALNFTDFLYRPRRPEELDTQQGGGVVFSQGAHQIDVLRMLAGSEVRAVRAVMGKWDASRPTEGVYSAMLWFENGAFATATYSGYAHFDSDIWMGGYGEMGAVKDANQYGAARRKLRGSSEIDESALKAMSTYGGPAFKLQQPPFTNAYQHFGPIIIKCENGDIRPLPDRIEVYDDYEYKVVDLDRPLFPRKEVVDEMVQAISFNKPTLHDGIWARNTLRVCLAMLRSAEIGKDIDLHEFK